MRGAVPHMPYPSPPDCSGLCLSYLPALNLTYPILFYPILCYSILVYPIPSCPILSYPILSYPILAYSILSYPVLSYSIVFYHILFYLVLSCSNLADPAGQISSGFTDSIFFSSFFF